jgi:TetR/AcrR family transcriptional regulator
MGADGKRRFGVGERIRMSHASVRARGRRGVIFAFVTRHESDAPPAPPRKSEPPPQKRERNAVETKKRLLDSAEVEFAAKGFAGARLRDVAQAAGVQQALIHHYFVDKDGLYRAVLERAMEETTAGSWSILGRSMSVAEMLEAFVDMLVDFYSSHANLLAILRGEAASGSSVSIEIMRERTKPVFDAVKTMIERYQSEGVVRSDLPAQDIIVSVLAMTIFPFQEAALLEALGAEKAGTPDAAATKRAIVAMATRGMFI